MEQLTDYSINFPHLHIYLHHVGKNIMIGNFSVAYYGIVIAIGMLAGLGIACWMAKRTGQKTDTYFDLALVAIICSVIGARVYYVIFRWDLYKDDLLSVFNLRQGGLAIYGGVIAAIITVFVFSRVRKLSMGLLCDTAGLGLVLGQVIGRWGNFFNREAFGGYTDGLFAMLNLSIRPRAAAAFCCPILRCDGQPAAARGGSKWYLLYPGTSHVSL